MIKRHAYHQVEDALDRQAAVALIGPRQVGKTTLALEIGKKTDALYLDLEASADRKKLADPALFLEPYEDRYLTRNKAVRASVRAEAVLVQRRRKA